MAGTQILPPEDPLLTGADWTNLLALNERADKGSEGISLTEWASGNTNKPEIAAGSVIEIGGAIFNYVSDNAITDGGGLADGWVYIKHVVAGVAGSQTLTPTLTNTFGTWDTAKQGYYDGNDRYSLFAMYRSGAITKIFTGKYILPINTVYDNNDIGTIIDGDSSIFPAEKIKYKVFDITINNGSLLTSLPHGISNAFTNRRVLICSYTYISPNKLNLGTQDGFNNTINLFDFDDTTLIVQRGASTNTYNFRITIGYV